MLSIYLYNFIKNKKELSVNRTIKKFISIVFMIIFKALIFTCTMLLSIFIYIIYEQLFISKAV